MSSRDLTNAEYQHAGKGALYKATAPALQDGDVISPLIDVNGNLKTTSADNVPANTARTVDTPVLPVQHVDATGTVGGVTLNTQIAGEDLTNGVMKVEQWYNYAYLVADGQVKASEGFVHTLTFSPLDAAATGGTIFLYNSLTEAAPTVFSYYIPAAALVPVTVLLDVYLSTGIYIGFTTVADVSVTVSYR